MDDEWLSLGAASELIGVHPATLRAWANQGRVTSQRTAGGHRRFRRSDLQRWSNARREPSPGIDMLIHSALGRVRMTMDHADVPWLDRLDAAQRTLHRDLGRRLMTDLTTVLNAETEASTPSEVARALGIDYAQLARRQGLPLTEAVQAFLFFRDTLVDSLIQMANYTELPGSPDWLMLSRRLNAFTNTVLLGLIETYQQPAA
ncbi:MAG TPA: helix-turn-helix domain-containing protein [Anaerolineae bacterium]|nr:helix-turn-helix domain-containing protein [Anaerolineae bacterium]